MPVSIDYIEETLTKVKSTISTNLQTYLTVIQVAKADGITLTAPIAENYHIYEVDSMPFFPVIEFIADSTDVVIAGGTWDEDDHHIIIKVHNATDQGKESDVSMKSYRFTKAIAEIILDNRTLDDTVIGIQITNVNYEPMMTDGYTFKQEVWIHCTIKRFGN